ncbi:hypothetical protein GGR56DRAFT_147989 [Xylariaceae sp. FL0804]|nr:hypothetical protein GGR56DRAFT_147989 [Xylariaceae sp. FL0804]
MEHRAPEERLLIYTKAQFAVISSHVLGLAFTKISVVAFYRRIFRSNIFVKFSNILLVINALWGIAFFIALLLQCVPVDAIWNQAAQENAHCFNPVPLYYGIAISDTIMDFVILAAPQPIIWRLQMPKRQKVAISGILLVGAFVLGSSAARVYFFFEAGKAAKSESDPIAAGFNQESNIARPSY